MFKKTITLTLLLTLVPAVTTPDQATTQTEAVKDNKSTFFSQLRYFIIAGITLQTAMEMSKGLEDKVTLSNGFDAASKALFGSFAVWMASKIKHLDPVADYWVKKINKGFEELKNN